jgi:hypothetical protein
MVMMGDLTGSIAMDTMMGRWVIRRDASILKLVLRVMGIA